MSWLVVIVVFCAVAAAVLLALPERSVRYAPGSSLPHRSVLAGVSLARRLGKTSKGNPAQEIADLLGHIGMLLRSGRSQQQVWKDVQQHWRSAERSDHLSRIIAEMAWAARSGRGAAEALAKVADDQPDKLDKPTRGLIRYLQTAITLADTTGIALADVVEELAAAYEAEAELGKTVQTAVAGPRMTQVVLALLPVAAVGVGQLIGAQPLQVLLGSPIGVICLLGGLVLMGVGMFWSRQMMRKVGAA